MAKKADSTVNILTLILIFIGGFAVFSLLGFLILIALLSTGIIPTK